MPVGMTMCHFILSKQCVRFGRVGLKLGQNKEDKKILHLLTHFNINHKKEVVVKICVGPCVVCDLEVTDGTCHSFSGCKPFAQEALLTGFV